MIDLWPRGWAVLLCWCLFGAAACTTGKTVIRVGAKNYTEQAILGEIISQHLSHRLTNVQIERHFELSGTLQADAALQNGDVDIYPEYTGAAVATVLQLTPRDNRQAIRDQVQEGYRLSRHCEWFGPLGFDNSFAIVIGRAVAAKMGVKTLSEAADKSEAWTFGILQEYQDRSDGLPLLMRNYRIGLGAPARAIGAGKLYGALERGEVNVIAAYSTDAGLDPSRFVVLTDDKQAFPPDEAGIVARTALLQSVAGLAEAIRELNGRITADQMRALNRRVELEKVAAERVASEFLKGTGL